MRLRYVLVAFFLFLLFIAPADAQSPRRKLSLGGQVRWADNGRPLPGSYLSIPELRYDVGTDTAGRFLFRVAPGEYTLQVSLDGFESRTIQIGIGQDMNLDIPLNEKINQLREVIVAGERPEDNVRRAEFSVSRLSMRTIRRQPALLGEVDVVRSVLLLPGVGTVGEGATGFNVRGGQIDQNLVLMDDAPLLNTGHLLGLFSSFNPDVVNTLTFHRGNVPAQFGGRASSVLNVRLRDANATRWGVKGGLGLIASRLLVEGPILKNKLAFYVAGRTSLTDALLRWVPNPAVRGARAGFYDVTAKMEWNATSRDKLFATFYDSFDRFKVAGDSLAGLEVNATSSLFTWRTTNLSAGWSRSLTNDGLLRIVGWRSVYRPEVSSSEPATAFRLAAAVEQTQVKADLTLKPHPAHQTDAGVSVLRYALQPGELRPTDAQSSLNPVTLRREQADEWAAYVQDEWTINGTFSLSAGLRYSLLVARGPGATYQYDGPPTAENVLDSTLYGAGQTMHTYGGPEPRLSLKIGLSAQSSIKVSAGRARQYLQLISNTTAALPTARWKLADRYVRPLISDQVSGGYFRNFGEGAIETSIEGFYKYQQNVTDYVDGADLLLEPRPETVLRQGVGRGYGVEVFVRKNTGRLTGWLSYTYQQMRYQINDPTVNFGRAYPVNFNRPHSLNVVANYQHTRRVGFSATFTLSSGRPVTDPASKFYVGGIYVPNFTERNGGSIPTYHRLDVGMTIEPPQTDKRFKSSWTFSIYNLYSRRNAYSVFYRTKNQSVQQYYNRAETYRLSVFGAILPAITYNFQF